MEDSSTNNIFRHLHLFDRLFYGQQTLNKHTDFSFDDVEYKNTYNLNNLYYRNNEDIIAGKPTDVLSIGCSQTFGVGVPEEHTWSSILNKISGLTTTNMGIVGGSAEQIVNAVIYYLNNIGKPKYIFALMPDFFRYHHVVDGRFYSKDQYTDIFTTSHLKSVDYVTGEMYLKDPIIKFPSKVDFIIPPYEGVKQYLLSVNFLQTLCEFSGIKFFWSSWHPLTNDAIINKFFYSDSFGIKEKYYITRKDMTKCKYLCAEFRDDKTCNYECIEVHKINIKKEHEIMWHIAADNLHIGVHNHLHIAENFLDKINF